MRRVFVVVALSAAMIGKAMGGTGAITLVDGSKFKFFINTNIDFATSSSASGAASEASYTQAVAASTLNGGTTMVTLNDAFDGYSGLSVNGTWYNNNGVATTECLGAVSGVDRQVVFNPQAIGNLTVSRKVFVPEDDAFARWANIITNGGTSDEVVTVTLKHNLGSDNATKIHLTDDGDTQVEPTDAWMVTFEDFSGTTSSDPRLGHVMQTHGGSVTLASNAFADGVNSGLLTYNDFTLAPGKTAIIVNLVTGQASRAAAVAKVQELVTMPPAVTRCLSADEQAAIANANLPPTVTQATAKTPVNVGEETTLTAVGSDPNAAQTVVLDWAFGDGQSGTGSPVTHAYATAGVYMPTVTASDSFLTTTPLATNSVEVLDLLSLAKMQVTLNFKKSGADSIKLGASVALPAGFSPDGKNVSVDVGGVQQSIALNAKGVGKGSGAKVKLNAKKGTLKATFKGAFAAALVDEGLVDGDVAKPGQARTVDVFVTVDGTKRLRHAALRYTAKAGKKGVAKGK